MMFEVPNFESQHLQQPKVWLGLEFEPISTYKGIIANDSTHRIPNHQPTPHLYNMIIYAIHVQKNGINIYISCLFHHI